MKDGLLKKYKKNLPINENTPSLSLAEGDTPLIFLENISNFLGIKLYGKLEGLNPTGSFKDRGMVMAVAKAIEEGSKSIICASTGNTSASAAAYAAKANLDAYVLIPKGKISMGKLSQATMYGAKIIQVEGNFDDALEMVKEIAKNEKITLVNSINPYRIQGQKTAAFEICEQLGKAPNILALPVGNAGNITAYWKGFKEWNKEHNTGLPRMFGFQAEGAAPIVLKTQVKNPKTIASAIQIGNPASWKYALEAKKESNGIIDSVSDDEIISAYKLLARKEGIFVEPGSATSLAGIIKMITINKIKKDETVVAIFTGNGLKDIDTALNVVNTKIACVSNLEELKNILKRR
ncbi:MAG: threonine synthase [Fusobacteriaceae bacterium]